MSRLLRLRMLSLLCVPLAILTIITAALAFILPRVISSISSTCSVHREDGSSLLCFIFTFFEQCLSTPGGIAYTACFLAFISILITATNIEFARASNSQSRMLKNPTITWLLANCFTGAVVMPVVLGAAIKRKDDWLDERERSDGSGTAALTLKLEGRQLSCKADTYAITTGVALGFVVPSAVLLWRCTPLTVVIWNLFPVYVEVFRRLSLYVLRRFGGNETTEASAASNKITLMRLYGFPLTLSIGTHFYFLYVVVLTHQEFVITPAIRLLMIDFFGIAACIRYWIVIESSWRVVVAMVGCIIVVPGSVLTALSFGWILKDLELGRPASSISGEESESLLSNSAGS